MIAKPYLTPEQQADLLRSRGLSIPDDQVIILKMVNYYKLINGYKEMFLDKNAMQGSSEDIYKSDASLDQIFALYLHDKMLSELLFSYISHAEVLFKTVLTNEFCSCYGSKDEYLNKSSYVDADNYLLPKSFTGDKELLHGKNLEKLINILNDRAVTGYSDSLYIRHYRKNYECVPLWVLQNNLTFGNYHHFYQLQKRNIQNAVCKSLAEFNAVSFRITPHKLLRALEVIVGFRNLCAHSERIYCAVHKGAHIDELIDKLAYILPYGIMVEMQERIIASGELLRQIKCLDVKEFNKMYTNKEDIPEEFR